MPWIVALSVLVALVAVVVVVLVRFDAAGAEQAAKRLGLLAIPLAILTGIVVPLVKWARKRASARPVPPATPTQVTTAVRMLAADVRNLVTTTIGDWQLDQPKLATRWQWNSKRWVSGSTKAEHALAELFTELSPRRLLICGDAGTGKTSIALLLMRQLLRDRADPDPVPVLLSVSDWTAERETLREWMIRRLTEDLPTLRAEDCGQDAPTALVEQRLVLPVLDGLDELPTSRRDAVLDRLGQTADDDSFILTCRTGLPERHLKQLAVTATLTPKPITPDTALAYLIDLGGDADGWRPLLADGTPLAKVLGRPLGLWLIRVIYLESNRDPAPLREFRKTADVWSHLLEDLVPQLIAKRHPVESGHDTTPHDHHRPEHRWEAEQARHWLTNLAIHLRDRGTTNFAWWRFTMSFGALPLAGAAFYPVAIGYSVPYCIAYTVLAGWSGLFQGLSQGISCAAMCVVALTPTIIVQRAGSRRGEPARRSLRLRGRGGELGKALLLGVILGPVFGGLLYLGLDLELDFHLDWRVWLPVTVVGGPLLTALAWGQSATVPDEAASPRSLLRDDRAIAWRDAAIVTALAGATTAALWLAGVGIGPALGTGLFGIGPSLVLAFGLGRRPSTHFLLARLHCARRRVLPWRLMDFLHDMHAIGILRQLGGVYQFRHVELLHHLAPTPRPKA